MDLEMSQIRTKNKKTNGDRVSIKNKFISKKYYKQSQLSTNKRKIHLFANLLDLIYLLFDARMVN
jgi:hypothetical protein